MPRIGFVSAIFFSIVLIGGALWFRFVRIPPYSLDLASIQRIEQPPSGNALLEDFYNTDAALATVPATSLTKTETVGRGLFSDYISLKSQGKVSSSSINAIAGKYAESIANFDLTIQKVTRGQIIVVPETETSLTIYGNTMANIRNKYKNLVATQVQKSGTGLADIRGQTFATFMSMVGQLYQASAEELLLVQVPASLAENHMNLINNYLESATVMESLDHALSDPIEAYAALSIYAKNSGKESAFLLNIQKVMMANGIIFNGVI